eukprot:m.53655 g.53655  ORF g.53655 m.53655 type:complete len:68 (+) comp16681_c1_seq1:154-357(+)
MAPRPQKSNLACPHLLSGQVSPVGPPVTHSPAYSTQNKVRGQKLTCANGSSDVHARTDSATGSTSAG